jgi:chromosome segregation ATPase
MPRPIRTAVEAVLHADPLDDNPEAPEAPTETVTTEPSPDDQRALEEQAREQSRRTGENVVTIRERLQTLAHPPQLREAAALAGLREAAEQARAAVEQAEARLLALVDQRKDLAENEADLHARIRFAKQELAGCRAAIEANGQILFANCGLVDATQAENKFTLTLGVVLAERIAGVIEQWLPDARERLAKLRGERQQFEAAHAIS